MVTQYIPITNDGLVLSSSPLIILDTAYYELWYGLSLGGEMTQHCELSPLPLVLGGSPATTQPCITLTMLPSATTFYFKVRRFSSDGQFSEWVNGNFTT